MSVIIFLIVLAVLILVHEWGHFIVAKKSNVRVDEFGLGFPPKLYGWKKEGSETEYTLNVLPLGGFVRIFGEDPTEEGIEDGPDAHRSMTTKPPLTQIAILAAGIVCNILIAWFFVWISMIIGVPTLVDDAERSDAEVVVTAILPDSPASEVMKIGDVINGVNGIPTVHVADVQSTIASSGGTNLTLDIERQGASEVVTVAAEPDIVDGEQYAIGIALGAVVVETHNPVTAIGSSFLRTFEMTGSVAVGLGKFFGELFTGNANFDQVTGPVGLAGLVGDASRLGLVSLLMFTAVISVNLALINLIPFPALDGGRILFVIIEVITQRPIPARAAQYMNMAGFLLLLLLMVVVTFNDIVRIAT